MNISLKTTSKAPHVILQRGPLGTTLRNLEIWVGLQTYEGGNKTGWNISNPINQTPCDGGAQSMMVSIVQQTTSLSLANKCNVGLHGKNSPLGTPITVPNPVIRAPVQSWCEPSDLLKNWHGGSKRRTVVIQTQQFEKIDYSSHGQQCCLNR